MQRIAESELIINSRGAIYHLDVRPEELADTIIVVGDPESGPLDIRRLARAVFQRDAGAVLHGVFLEKVAGRFACTRFHRHGDASGVLTDSSEVARRPQPDFRT